LLSDPPPSFGESDGPDASEAPAAGFAFPYPSANHPPPLNAIAGAVITRSSTPPHFGQTVISGSENFCIFSVRLWQAVHSYS
jgi:hypothetical protein